MKRLTHPIFFIVITIGVVAILFSLNILLGSVVIPFGDIVHILLTGEHMKSTWVNILWDFRLPKALTAMLAGSALALSGLLMQTLFRNSLAGPFVLGITSGASLGVALALLGTGTILASLPLMNSLGIAGSAITGSFLVMLLILMVSRKVVHNMTILIMGLMFGYLANAFVSFLIFFSDIDNLQVYVLWTLGNFNSTGWNDVTILFIVVLLGALFSLLLSKSLDVLLMGDHYAQSMGVHVKKSRNWIILITSILAGSVTAFCGPIAFLGLAVPHLCRGLTQSTRHLFLIPSVCLLGSGLALLADLVASLPGSQKMLPLNSVTALIGAPVIIWVILKNRSAKGSIKS